MRTPSRTLLAALLVPAILWALTNASSRVLAQETPTSEPVDEQQPTDEPEETEQPAPLPGSGPTTAPSSPMPAGAIAGMVSVFIAFYVFIILFAVVVGVGGLILSCLAIYDCARRDFPDPNTRAMWCLLIALLRLIGAIVYYFVIYRKNDPPIQRPRLIGAPPPSPMSG